MFGAGLSEPNLNYYITTRLLLNLADRNKYTFSLEEAKEEEEEEEEAEEERSEEELTATSRLLGQHRCKRSYGGV